MLDHVRFVIDITDAPDFIDGIRLLDHQVTGDLRIREAHLELEDLTPDGPLAEKLRQRDSLFNTLILPCEKLEGRMKVPCPRWR